MTPPGISQRSGHLLTRPMSVSQAVTPSSKSASYPKFHWWWAENVQYDTDTPADPGYYYHKSQLRCYTVNGSDTQIWEGQVKTEDQCMNKCDRNPNCSKYLWQVYEQDVYGTNCWIWSYNRSNHMCNLTDYDWNVASSDRKARPLALGSVALVSLRNCNMVCATVTPTAPNIWTVVMTMLTNAWPRNQPRVEATATNQWPSPSLVGVTAGVSLAVTLGSLGQLLWRLPLFL